MKSAKILPLLFVLLTVAYSSYAQYITQWIDVAGATYSNNILTKTTATGYGNVGGARSSNVLPAGTDGWMEFTITNQKVQVGFVVNNLNTISTYTHSIQITSSNGIRTYEAGTNTAYGNVVSGNIFRIARVGSVVNYYKNGALLRSVPAVSTQDLYVRVLVYAIGGTSPAVTSSFDQRIFARPVVNGVNIPGGTGTISTSAVGGTSPYSYNWSNGGTAPSISAAPGVYTANISDGAGRSSSTTANLGYRNYWTNLTGVSDNNGVLTKTGTAGWNGGAVSVNFLAPNTNGWIEFICPKNANINIGFATNLTQYANNRFTQSIRMDDAGVLYAHEASTTTTIGTWGEGEVWRISREGSQVKYYRNGTVFRTVSVSPTLQLYSKVVLHSGLSPAVSSSFWMSCASQTSLGLLIPYYTDGDGDGYGGGAVIGQACTVPLGFSANNGDCNDAMATVHPGALEICGNNINEDCDTQTDESGTPVTFYIDADGDSYGSTAATIQACARPAGYSYNSADCNDAVAAIRPNAVELCDGIDNDCDGLIDEGATIAYYVDQDGDGFGLGAIAGYACSPPAGYAGNANDCNDASSAIRPGATEVCDGIDNNCNGQIDEGVTIAYYADQDGDGFGFGIVVGYACSVPAGYVSNVTDCNDTNTSIRPGATEICDGIDNDCDGQIDENVLTTYYVDFDGDGFGAAASQGIQACAPPAGYAANAGDCNDAITSIHPGAAEVCGNGIDDDCDGQADELSNYYPDGDGDGYGSGIPAGQACAAPPGYSLLSNDCQDQSASINPGRPEICANGVDDNCDAQVDQGGTLLLYYADSDGDGYGAGPVAGQTCSAVPGFSFNNLDCNDGAAVVHPGATEVCGNGIDEDCDGQIDEVAPTIFYLDADGDGYGSSSTVMACVRPTGYASLAGDCNDGVAAIRPNAAEVCDGFDNNCNGLVDEGVLSPYYADQDGDGFGSGAIAGNACSPPTGYSFSPDDCNDTSSTIHPGATEVCDGIDNDCNGQVDDGALTTYYADGDGDGYGAAASQGIQACTPPSGYVANAVDCNDAVASVHPGATEVCGNGIDDDCDGQTDEIPTYYQDADGDGHGTNLPAGQACTAPPGYSLLDGDCNDANGSISPGSPEICANGIDDNCDGQIDQGGAVVPYYTDADADGYGSGSSSAVGYSCIIPPGFSANNIDCNDAFSSVHPGALEICGNNIDEDCDNQIDESGTTLVTFYRDVDGDSYGTTAATVQACARPAGYSYNATDCNDAVYAIHPNAVELCDGLDNDCDGQIDEGVTTAYYVDQDGDGFGFGAIAGYACSPPAGHVGNANDCNDASSAIRPGATELCDGLDNNCNGQVDEVVLHTYYVDVDGDGYGSVSQTIQACIIPAGYVANGSDCNDALASVHPGAPEICGNGINDDCDGQTDEVPMVYRDNDGDGYGTGNPFGAACVAPPGFALTGNDCNDANSNINPGRPEICGNGIDDNCDAQTDVGGAFVVFYRDADGDGYGIASVTLIACVRPAGYVINSGDCNDANVTIRPGAPELCDGLDNNCDGQIENILIPYYADQDGDGYGAGPLVGEACAVPSGYSSNDEDCNDMNDTAFPWADELCDGIDNNCDGYIDEENWIPFYVDQDGDGFGTGPIAGEACAPPPGFSTNHTDCNDTNASIHPGAVEICDGINNDCDAQVDEGLLVTYYPDADADTYGVTALGVSACSAPPGYITRGGDCNDTNNQVYPGAIEICGNGIDDDCDNQVDELTVFYRDVDGDGFGANFPTTMACTQPAGYARLNGDCNDTHSARYPGAPEICGNGIDENCNGSDLPCGGRISGSAVAATGEQPAIRTEEVSDGDAYPNPFFQSVTIPIRTEVENSLVSIHIFNTLGQPVRTVEACYKTPGDYEIEWDGTAANPSTPAMGLLLYKVTINGRPGSIKRIIKLGQ